MSYLVEGNLQQQMSSNPELRRACAFALKCSEGEEMTFPGPFAHLSTFPEQEAKKI